MAVKKQKHYLDKYQVVDLIDNYNAATDKILKDTHELYKKIGNNSWTWTDLQQSNKYEQLFSNIQKQLVLLGQKETKTLTSSLNTLYKDSYTKSNIEIFSTLQNSSPEFIMEALGSNTPGDSNSWYSYIMNNYTEVKANQPYMAASLYLMNDKAIEKAINYNWSGVPFSDRLWRDKDKLYNTLKTEITQSITLGESMRKTALRISNAMQSSYKNAMRISRTESARIVSEASKDNYNSCGVKKIEWSSGVDKHIGKRTIYVCDECRARDGKEYPIDDCPTQPEHPNCRCTYLPVVSSINIEDAKWYKDMQDEEAKKLAKAELNPQSKEIKKQEQYNKELLKVNKELDKFKDIQNSLNQLAKDYKNGIITTAQYLKQKNLLKDKMMKFANNYNNTFISKLKHISKEDATKMYKDILKEQSEKLAKEKELVAKQAAKDDINALLANYRDAYKQFAIIKAKNDAGLTNEDPIKYTNLAGDYLVQAKMINKKYGIMPIMDLMKSFNSAKNSGTADAKSYIENILPEIIKKNAQKNKPSNDDIINKYLDKKLKDITEVNSLDKRALDRFLNANFEQWTSTSEYRKSGMQQHVDKWLDELSTSDKKIINWYTGSYYRKFNHYLRTGELPNSARDINGKTVSGKDDVKSLYEKYAKQLKKSLGFKAPMDFTTYRGSSLQILNSISPGIADTISELVGKDNGIKDIKDILQGTIMSDKATTSSSYIKGANFSGSLQIISRIPKGSQCGGFVDNLSEYGSEKEFLFSPGTEWYITNVKLKGNTLVVYADVINKYEGE